MDNGKLYKHTSDDTLAGESSFILRLWSNIVIMVWARVLLRLKFVSPIVLLSTKQTITLCYNIHVHVSTCTYVYNIPFPIVNALIISSSVLQATSVRFGTATEPLLYKNRKHFIISTMGPLTKGHFGTSSFVGRLSSFGSWKCIAYTLLGILEVSFVNRLSFLRGSFIRGSTVFVINYNRLTLGSCLIFKLSFSGLKRSVIFY